MSTANRIESLLARFAALHKSDIDLGLERIRVLLSRLGDPHLKLPPVVHVAGTNGKGSTIAFLAAMAKASGRSTHLHTSPHLVHLNERYVLAGNEITDPELLELLREVETVNQGTAATQYELLTAAMFLGFARTKADLAIIEVGLGGELDATNVLPNPALCLITPIAVEHTDWLGSDLAGIAEAKAGIIKTGCSVLSAAQPDEVRDVLFRTAARRHAQIHFAEEDFHGLEENGRLVWQNEERLLDLPLPNLLGAHQINNAGLAIAAAIHFGWSEQAIAKGLQTADWPGRLQAIHHLDPVSDETEIWVDGAHNPHAARALANFIMDRERKDPRPLHIILSMQATKDIQAFLQPFASLSPELHLVPLPTSPFPTQAQELQSKIHQEAMVYFSLSDALGAIPPGARLLITGSLYLAGDVLAQIKTPTETAGV